MNAIPSARAQIVEARTYLRPLDDEGTIFETPEQAADRIIGHQRWLWERAKGGMHRVTEVSDLPQLKFDDPIGYRVEDGWVMIRLTEDEEAELQELKDLFLDRKLTVAGRTRWLGGTPIAKERESSQFNPLSADTSFVTAAGVRTFEDFEDGDRISVLTHAGRFRDAFVSDSGMRKMLKLHLRRGRTRYTQRTSVEHTWIKIDGTRVEAQDLSVGDKLWRTEASDFFNWDFSAATPDEQLWWCYGFVYGDGAINAYGRTSCVRLCGNKAKYLPRFVSCGFEHSFPPSCATDPFVYTGHYLKTLPTAQDDPRLIAAFLRGYLAADGHKVVRHGRESITSITTTSLEAADFVRTWLPVFGVFVLSDEQDVRETNYGTYEGTRFSFTIGGGAAWCVEAIEEAEDEHCWCLTVDEDHSFVLSNGVVSGNCSFLEVRNVHDVVDATWLLLQGCGVGFRPVVGTLNGFAQPMEIEVIRSKRGPYEKGPENNVETFDHVTKTWTIKVGDSSSAWAKSAGKLVSGKYHAKKLVLDFSLVRGGGGRLKNYGWISSGDAQIAKAYLAIAQILNSAAGRLLTRIEILDIMNWLGTILSSRRSAEIAVMAYNEPEWQDFALAKKDMWTTGRDHRQMSNNSIMFYQKPTKYQLSRIFKIMMDAGGSEPGFINAQAAMKRAPWFKGVNPCVPADTRILTDKGYIPIADAVGTEVRVWNGSAWSAVTPFSTGVNPLVTVNLSDGTSLKCTPTHEWVVKDTYRSPPRKVAAQSLSAGMRLAKFDMPIVHGGKRVSGDMYSQGFYSGDGNTGLEFSWVYEPKFSVIPALVGRVTDKVSHGRVRWTHGPMREKTWVPHGAALEQRVDWLAGLLDADGNTVSGLSGTALQLVSCDLDFLKEVRLLLTTMGVQAKINLMHAEGRDFDGYVCRACWRLLINTADTHRLVNECGLKTLRLQIGKDAAQRDARRFVTVTSVVDTGRSEETYCFTEPQNNTGTFEGIVTGQCCEIMLGDLSFCNLVETVLPRFNDDVEGLHRAHRLVARANYRQTCVNLDDGVLQRGWHELNEFLRLCGVGVTGVVSWQHWEDPAAWSDLREVAIDGANSMADELGLPRAKAVTTVKPSGTQSKALGIVGHEVPEGIHMPIGRFIFNRIRFSAHDPIINKLREANYAIEPDPSYPTGVLAVIPVEFAGIKFDTVQVGDETIEVNNESAIAQLDRYKLLMDNYVDHNASITISYDPEEVPEIVDWLMANWDTYVGVSFIYRQDATRTAADLGYKYLPQTLVSEKTYRAYADNLLPVNLSENAAAEMLADSMECAGGACPVR